MNLTILIRMLDNMEKFNFGIIDSQMIQSHLNGTIPMLILGMYDKDHMSTISLLHSLYVKGSYM